MPVLTYFPQTRLAALIGRFGGISRSDAIESAMKELEGRRGESDAEIENSISQLEALVKTSANAGQLTPASMLEVLRLCDQIVTLSGIFQYIALDVIAKSLCDVADGLNQTNRYDLSPIQVHVQAIRMVAPSSPPLSEDAIQIVLAELAKIISFYGFTSASDSVGRSDIIEPGPLPD